uniref:Centromere-associated protein E-like isoform X1 n=1 Tax=Crassostrea virginica TaxID=6565 RepID=A0A8B8A8P6_CRAVI|nr:centromere-associated protein E-like isoform X1 [Crassostrea virginica]
MKCLVKLTLCVVLLPLCMLTKGQIIYLPTQIGKEAINLYDTELQHNNLNEEIRSQMNHVNFRTTALYNVVKAMEQSLLKQGLIEKVVNMDSKEFGQSVDVHSKLVSLERKLEKEITNWRNQDINLRRRVNILESETTIIATNVEQVASSVQSTTTESGKLQTKLRELEINNSYLSNEMINLKIENMGYLSKVKQMNSSKLLLEFRFENLTNSFMDLQGKINFVSNSHATADKAMDMLTRSTKDRALEIHGIKQLINNIMNEQTALKKENLAFRTEIENFRTQLISFQSSYENVSWPFSNVSRLLTNGKNINSPFITTNETVPRIKAVLLRNLDDFNQTLQIVKHDVSRLSRLQTLSSTDIDNLKFNMIQITSDIKRHTFDFLSSTNNNSKEAFDKHLRGNFENLTIGSSDPISEKHNISISNHWKDELSAIKMKIRALTQSMENVFQKTSSLVDLSLMLWKESNSTQQEVDTLYQIVQNYNSSLRNIHTILHTENNSRDHVAEVFELLQEIVAKNKTNYIRLGLQSTHPPNAVLPKSETNDNHTLQQIISEVKENIGKDFSIGSEYESLVLNISENRKSFERIFGIIAQFNKSFATQYKKLEENISILRSDISSIMLPSSSSLFDLNNTDNIRKVISGLRQQLDYDFSQQERVLKTMVNHMFQNLSTDISDIRNNAEMLKSSLQTIGLNSDELKKDVTQLEKNVSNCRNSLEELVMNQTETLSRLSDVTTSQDMIKVGLINSSLSLLKEQDKIIKSSKNSLMPQTMERIENFTNIQSEFSESMHLILESLKGQHVVHSQKRTERRLEMLEMNVSAMASILKEIGVIVQNLTGPNDLSSLVYTNKQYVQDLKEMILDIKQDVAYLQTMSAEILINCNATNTQVQNITKSVDIYNNTENKRFRTIFNDLNTLIENVSLTSSFIGNEAKSIAEIKQEIAYVKQSFLHNLTDQETRLRAIMEKKIQDFSRNISYTQNEVFDFISLIKRGRNDTNKLYTNVSLFTSVLSKLLMLYNETKGLLEDAKKIQMSVQSNVNLISASANDSQDQALNKYAQESDTRIAEILNQITNIEHNVSENTSNMEKIMHSVQNHTNDIAILYDKQSQLYVKLNISDEINLKYTSAKISKLNDSILSDLYQMESSVNDLKEAFRNSIEQCRQNTHRLESEMQENKLMIQQNFTELKDVSDKYITSSQNNAHELIVLRNSSDHCNKRLDNLERNISTMTTTTEQLEYLISDVRSLKGAVTNVSSYRENIEDLKSMHLQVQRDLSTVKVSSSLIWSQCNETAQKVDNASKIFAVSETKTSNQLIKLLKDVRALQENVSLYWNSVENERAIVDKLNSRLDTLQKNVFNNFTLHDDLMKTEVAENVQSLVANISSLKDESENLQRVFKQLDSITQRNAENILLCHSTVSGLSAKINGTSLKLDDTTRKQLLIKSNLDHISLTINNFQIALNNSAKDCCNFTKTRVSHLETQMSILSRNSTKVQNDLDYLMSSMQNQSNEMFMVEQSLKQHIARLDRLEEDITGIAVTTEKLETQISNSTSLNDVLTNVTINKQYIRNLLSFSYDMQHNVSSIQLSLTKAWRQCNSTEEYVQNMTHDRMSIQDLSSTFVKLSEDLQAIRELSSVIWHQCNRTEEQAVNISKLVSVLSVLNSRQHKSLEQELFSTQENISSLYALLRNDAGRVNTLNGRIKDLNQTVFHNLTRQKQLLNSMIAEKFRLLDANFTNIENISKHLQLSLDFLDSKIQQNAKNITICHSGLSKVSSEQNKTNQQVASLKMIQSNVSRISTSFNEFRFKVNKSINECNNFTLTYVSEIETHLQMIKNNYSKSQGDLDGVMKSVQNHTHEISRVYKIQERYRERLATLEGSLSMIRNTTTNLEMITASLVRLDDAITNVTINANNFRDLRLTSSELQQNLSSLWNLSSMIWQQCNTTEDRVQNISTMVKANPIIEREILKLQYNVTALTSYVEVFANETKNGLSNQADKQSAFTTKFENNLININLSEELEERLKENQFCMTSIMNNVSVFEKRLELLSTKLSLNNEVINSVQHNLTNLFERFQNASMHGQFSVDQVTQPATQSLVRLVDGTSASEGRVEVFHGGVWGTVCDDSWDSGDATVVCRMLGYTGRASAFERAHFGPGTGSIFLDEVRCTGLEDSIFSCHHDGIERHDCGHSEDASVSCS